MILDNLKLKILKKGGFVNSHAHLDRAYTYDCFSETERIAFLTEKWKLVDRIRQSNLERDYKTRLHLALDRQKEKGVSHVMSFIDLDSTVGTKAINAAFDVKNERNDIQLLLACQTLKGVLDPKESSIIEENFHKVDIIGALPKADGEGRRGAHLDVVMSWAKKYDKRLHVHVDQLNLESEKETELLALKTMQHGLEGKVSAVHSISLACHPKEYRQRVYQMSKDAGLSFISCPSAWIDSPRQELLTPTHNSLTPVEELLEHDLCVAIGSDNIHDVYKPYADGDMMFELRLLLESFKLYDDDLLIKIAVDNGKQVLGI